MREEEGSRDLRAQARQYAPRAGSRTLLAWPGTAALAPVSWPPGKRLPERRLAAVRGAIVNSDERREARRRRREAKRAANRAERIKDCTLENVASADNLYIAAKQAARGVGWKASVQRYQKNVLRNVVKTRAELLNGEDICRGFTHFDLWERGKLRHISSVKFSERVAHKSLTQNALIPAIRPTLVDSNSANIKGKGTSYAIATIKRQLAEHYRKHGREGYILQIDFEDYFASIHHDQAKRVVSEALDDWRLVALAHHLIDVQGEVGLGLGSEPNQILAVSIPSKIDHFVLEMLGIEAYGRYMDDSYCIHTDKEYLHIVQELIEWKCRQLGIKVNRKKTRIVKLSRGFTFLKKRFFYTETGRVVVKPCRDTITHERRKLKSHAKMYRAGLMTYEQAEQSYQSWRGGMLKLDAHRTVLSMDALFKELFGPEIAAGGGASLHGRT